MLLPHLPFNVRDILTRPVGQPGCPGRLTAMLHLHASTMQCGHGNSADGATREVGGVSREIERACCHSGCHALSALLIVMLAIGVPIPAKADCSGQGACNIDVEQRIAPSWPLMIQRLWRGLSFEAPYQVIEGNPPRPPRHDSQCHCRPRHVYWPAIRHGQLHDQDHHQEPQRG